MPAKICVVLIALVVLAGCQAQPATKPHPQPTKPPVAVAHHAVVFPKNWRHTWYTVDAQGDLHKMKITANAIDTTPVYWVGERSTADNRLLDSAGPANPAHRNWAAARRNLSWLNLRGWYQQNGSGTSYRLVGAGLQAAAGPQPKVYATYYRTAKEAQHE